MGEEGAAVAKEEKRRVKESGVRRRRPWTREKKGNRSGWRWAASAWRRRVWSGAEGREAKGKDSRRRAA
jgi:hypothetical protein